MRGRLTRRQVLAGGLVTAGATAVAGTVAVQAIASGPDPQAILVGILNGERRWNRLAPAIGNPGLQQQAEQQAERLAFWGVLNAGMHLTQGQLDWWLHPDRGLRWIGEILAVGAPTEGGLLDIDQQWIRSPGHRAILLAAEARLIGVGVREGHGRYWASAVLAG